MKKIWIKPELKSLQVEGTSSGTNSVGNESSALTVIIRECERVKAPQDNTEFPRLEPETVCPDPEAYVEVYKPFLLAS